MLAYERRQWDRGNDLVAGVDEVGRGPLAGPVVAAAVAATRAVLEAAALADLVGLTDSKKLSPPRRERFAECLRAIPGLTIGLGIVDAPDIDRLNILQATHQAMAMALRALPGLPDHALVDGRPVPGLPCAATAIVGGDGLSLLIAAASVIAKVFRDRMMVAVDADYPDYGFARHKGYGSSAHIRALFAHGPCPLHRRTFRPVREVEAIRRRPRP